MKKRLISIAKYLIFLLIGVGLLWYVFKDQDIRKIVNDLKQANYIWIALAIFLGILSHVSRAVRWNLLIAPLGDKPKFIVTFGAVMIGYLTNFAIPRAGEIVRCGVVRRYSKVRMNSLIGTIIVERATDMIMVLILTLLAVLLQIRLLGGFIKNELMAPFMDKLSSNANSIFIYLFFFLVFLSLFYLAYRVFRNRILQSKFFIKLKDLFLGFITGLKTIRTMKNFGWYVFHSFFIWGMYFLMGYVAFFALSTTSH